MRVYCAADYNHASRVAANIISAQVIMKPDCVLGLATGSTPVGTYEELIRRYEQGDLDFSRVHSINLDEYRGLAGDNDQSYRYFMNTHLFDSINIDKKNTYVPDGLEPDSEKACRDYEEIIKAHGGVDLQILGLGHNGHIGFNEPGSTFEKETHCVTLSETTRQANARFFSSMDEVPTEAYTMGIGSIMQAKKIVVIVTGEGKREIVKKAFLGPITPEVQASVLQLHNDVILVGDEAALADFPR
ncbi:MAG: glucosamine-6-phosphate deaminase [Lachnospiraceae bacterium]|jgi:glucosamine-6-phosphate deaminase|nr:glucosamine-6-phosphate deaminase [Lachnospiraceae bacterium]MCI9397076.1 glucosamine-6-phosphate deaminase [Lachnospiraceae bacterium]